MKTDLMTSAIISALLLTANLTADACPNHSMQKNAKERVRQEVIQGIPCPDFIQENDIINQVKVIVQVEENGSVKVIEINSANVQLKTYVLDQLQNMKIKNPGESQKFVLLINFRIAE